MSPTVKVNHGGPVHRALTRPTLARTRDRRRAAVSFWTWREEPGGWYRLTPLGVLHALTGLQLKLRVR